MAKAVTAKARKGDTIVDRLREELGVRGVLVRMAKRRQIIELRCEMPNCYCHKGRAHFDPKSHPPGPWEPSPDHYPGSSPMADTSTLGTSGSRTCFATERTMPGACGLEGCSRRGCRWTRSPTS
jgi:hypothetical protein